MTDATWQERQQAAHEKVEAIKAREGAKVVDGEDYDLAELISAEAEMAILISAEGEDLRRQQAAADRDRSGRIRAIKAKVSQLAYDRGEAIDAIETNLVALRDAIAVLFRTSDEMGRLMTQIGASVPTAMSDAAMRNSLSYRICSILRPASGNRLGNLEIKTFNDLLPDGTLASKPWRDEDAKRTNIPKALKGALK